MTTASQIESWETLDWKSIQKNVYHLQKRIYQASLQQNYRQVHNLQRLLLHSRSARLLAVRQVTQDNRGKRSAGVDGIKSLEPEKRLELANMLDLKQKPSAIRRVYIPKADGSERPLGIPTLRDRAHQALVKLALEPEWEAKFEPNSYGFRPGRSAHDAIGAIFNSIRQRNKYVLDADIEKCFDRINHQTLLAKLHTFKTLRQLIKRWLQAGVLEDGKLLFPTEGTPQGGVISPLLANVALHGLEQAVTHKGRSSPQFIRYADDFVLLHHDKVEVLACKEKIEAFLTPLGLRLKPSKTRITHTLTPCDGNPGFDFLGFHIQQYKVGRHHSGKQGNGELLGFKTIITPSKKAIRQHYRDLNILLKNHISAPLEVLAIRFNALVRGWTNYYSTVVSQKTFDKLQWDTWRNVFTLLRRRTQRKVGKQRIYKMCNQLFSETLIRHGDTKIERHVKVRGMKSPFDGDWMYWASRLGRHPELSALKAKLLKSQKGKCAYCHLPFATNDVLEKHHLDGNHLNNKMNNLHLVHGHCHDALHRGTYDRS
jgi:RNA-directed DNA polymerase